MVVILIVASILILLLAVLLSKAEIIAEYKDKKLDCGVYLYKIRIYTLKGDGKLLKKLLSQPEKFGELYSTAIRLIEKYVEIKTIELKILVGTSDAASTAIATGTLWASVYTLIGLIGKIAPIENHKVDIAPDYVNAVFSVDGKCIIKSRTVHIIIIVITILMKINPKKGKEEIK